MNPPIGLHGDHAVQNQTGRVYDNERVETQIWRIEKVYGTHLSIPIGRSMAFVWRGGVLHIFATNPADESVPILQCLATCRTQYAPSVAPCPLCLCFLTEWGPARRAVNNGLHVSTVLPLRPSPGPRRWPLRSCPSAGSFHCTIIGVEQQT